jgi:hypothetical protein
MTRSMLALALLVFAASVAFADPPSSGRVLAKANVPPQACDATVVGHKLAAGLVLPVPGLGFLPLPIEVWSCHVSHTPPNAPAGVPKCRTTVRLFTLAE